MYTGEGFFGADSGAGTGAGAVAELVARFAAQIPKARAKAQFAVTWSLIVAQMLFGRRKGEKGDFARGTGEQ